MYSVLGRRVHLAPCLSSKILHNHCFQFLLGITVVPRKIKHSSYAFFFFFGGGGRGQGALWSMWKKEKMVWNKYPMRITACCYGDLLENVNHFATFCPCWSLCVMFLWHSMIFDPLLSLISCVSSFHDHLHPPQPTSSEKCKKKYEKHKLPVGLYSYLEI